MVAFCGRHLPSHQGSSSNIALCEMELLKKIKKFAFFFFVTWKYMGKAGYQSPLPYPSKVGGFVHWVWPFFFFFVVTWNIFILIMKSHCIRDNTQNLGYLSSIVHLDSVQCLKCQMYAETDLLFLKYLKNTLIDRRVSSLAQVFYYWFIFFYNEGNSCGFVELFHSLRKI